MSEVIFFIALIAGFLGLLLALIFYFLVMRPREAHEVAGSLDMVLLRVLLPRDEIPAPGEPKQKDPKEIMVAMEQLYAALEALRTDWWHDLRFGAPAMTFEMALPHVGEEVIFYVAIPRVSVNFFSNQIQSFFHSAKIEHAGDYNIFNPAGVSAGSVAVLKSSSILPLRTYRDLGEDPLAVLVNAFAKLKQIGEGAAIQCVIRPAREVHYAHGNAVAKRVRDGEHIKDVLKSQLKREAEGFARASVGMESKKPKTPEPQKTGDEDLAKKIEAKAGSPGFEVNIRILASAVTGDETLAILQSLEAAFAQFADPQANAIMFERLGGRELEEMMYDFSFRLYDGRRKLYLSATELSGMFHFPYAGFSHPKVMYLRAREAPPPANLPHEGALRLGYNVFRGQQKNVFITQDDRRRHMYVIGQTGTGKSTLLKEMAIQDIEAGRGLCFIDPHGQDIESILEAIPESRLNDVVYFNPADTERPMGLNFLEYDPNYPEQKTFIVNELLAIFNKLYNMSVAGGPMFEQYFRNATMLVMEDPSSGSTLLEVSRVLADKEFRNYKLSRCSNIVVETFWKQIAEKAGGESSLANMVPYITSKTDTFVSNEIMRPIIAQEKNSFNFREIMDKQKILLINLSKGRLGELNASLLGLIIVGKILMAALSRTDTPEHDRKDFYLYIDEFQNVTTNSIATILSEARKYRLGLVVAHQFLGQLTDDIKKAVFGNVGTMIAFRIGSDDGEFMERQFSPVFTASDLLNIENRNAYVKLLIHGEPARSFNMKVYPPTAGTIGRKQAVVELSRTRYGRSRTEVEESIRKRYQRA